MKHPRFHWRNRGLIPPMGGGMLQLAGHQRQHLPCPIRLPIEAPPLSLVESGPDSANGNGGRWDLEGVHLQNDLKKNICDFFIFNFLRPWEDWELVLRNSAVCRAARRASGMAWGSRSTGCTPDLYSSRNIPPARNIPSDHSILIPLGINMLPLPNCPVADPAP